MANFNSLPYEIQQLILQYIDSTKQLGECRRVCKRWDSPAECAMFSRKLYITPYNSTSLYMHLSRKPLRANLIKEIDLDTAHFTDTMALLLQLAATPSLREIASDVYPNIRFYQTLARIAKDSRMKLQHLKSIPLPSAYSFTETYCQTILLLKDSLEHINIPPSSDSNGPHEISKRLDEFKCLSTLHVDCVFQNLPQAESIFRGARKLNEIDLSDCYINQDNGWLSEESLHWMKQNVEINETPMTLFAIDDSNLSISLIEYFLYKYPNMRQFDYYIGWTGNMVPEVEISTRACLSISKIPRYTLNLAREHQWRSHYRSFAGYKNTSKLYYEGEVAGPGGINISSTIEQDQKRNTQFQFTFGNVFDDEFFDDHVALLEDIGAFTTKLYMDFQEPDMHCFDVLNRSQSKAFFTALKTMNHLDDMQFRSPGRLEAVDLGLPSQYKKRRLKTLEIYYPEIQPAAFHTLDRLFHAIDTLKLSSYSIKRDSANTMCIHMPSIALEKLSIAPYFVFKQNTNSSKKIFIMLNLQQEVALYFKLEPFNNNAHQVSFVDYSSRPRDSTAFSIHTRLIACIELDLGRNIRANINVQKYCKTLDAAFDELRLND